MHREHEPVIERVRLSTPQFRWFWASVAVSSVGDQFFTVALPWLVLEVAGSDVALGSILMTAALPRAALMLAGGALSDRVPPARVLLLTNILRAVLVATAAALVAAARMQLWQLYPLAVAFGVLGALSGPASTAVLPRLVRHEQLTGANGVVQATAQAGAMVAPAPAGALIASAGVASALGVSAAASALAGVALAWIPTAAPQNDRRREERADEADRSDLEPARPAGTLAVVRAYLRDPALRAYLVLVVALSLATSGPLAVGIPSLARTRYAGSVSFGFMLSASGAGTLVGALLAGARQRVRHRGLVLLTLNVLIGVLLMLLGFAPTAAVASLVIASIACASAFVSVVATATLQAQADRATIGRTMSVVLLASIGLAPVSYLLAGFVSAANPALLFGAAGTLVILATANAASSRALRRLD